MIKYLNFYQINSITFNIKNVIYKYLVEKLSINTLLGLCSIRTNREL